MDDSPPSLAIQLPEELVPFRKVFAARFHFHGSDLHLGGFRDRIVSGSSQDVHRDIAEAETAETVPLGERRVALTLMSAEPRRLVSVAQPPSSRPDSRTSSGCTS